MSKPVVYVQTSQWVTPTVFLNKGEIWDAEDPLVRAAPNWFTDDPYAAKLVRTSTPEQLPVVPDPKPAPKVVEEATAEPGTTRRFKR